MEKQKEKAERQGIKQSPDRKQRRNSGWEKVQKKKQSKKDREKETVKIETQMEN